MDTIPNESAEIASISIPRTEISAPGTLYGSLVSDWAEHRRILGSVLAHKQYLSADQRRRNEVEGFSGSGKRKYSLELNMVRLSKGAENSISLAFVVMCAEKLRRLLRLFFITILAWLCTFKWPGCLWMGLRDIWLLEKHESLATGKPCVWAA